MKTSKNLTGSFAKAITCAAFVLTSSLLISSCQKEEEQVPGKPQNPTTNEKTMDSPTPPTPHRKQQIATVNDKIISLHDAKLAFAQITIDHYAAGTNQPDYSVSVSANGTATFKGRRNVNVDGLRMMEVSNEQLANINRLVLQLRDLPDVKENSNEFKNLMARPINRTTITNSSKSTIWSLSDDNLQPKWLVEFRKQVENELKISRLIYAPGQLAEINK